MATSCSASSAVLRAESCSADACDKLPFARGQPANCRGFLAGGELNELRRLAIQLDFAGIQKEKFRAVMPDARANLPANERILIRWIVADEEYRLGFVKLLHRQRGVAGAFRQAR